MVKTKTNILLLFFSVFLSISFSLNGQETIHYIDSLKQTLKETNKVQTQVDIHMKLCWVLRNKNPEEAIFHGNSALALIEENNLKLNYAQALNYLGVVHRNKGEYDYALDLYKQALEWALKTNNKIQTAYSYNNIGGIYILKSSYPEAIESIQKAKKIFEEEGLNEGVGYASVNLGNLYRHLKSYSESMQYFDEAQKIKTALNDTIGLTVVKQLKADVLKEQGKTTEAEQLLQELKEEYRHNNDIKGTAIVTNELGSIELLKGNYKSAITMFLDAEKQNLSIDNKQGLAYNAINLGLAYSHTGNFELALKKLQEGLERGSVLGDRRTILMAYNAFAEVYSSRGKWREAYNARKNYEKIYSELYNFEQSEQINSIRDKYINEKRYYEQKLLEEKNAKLEQQNTFNQTRIKYLLIGSGVIVFFLLVVSTLIYFYLRRVNESKKNTELLSRQNAELQEANTTKEKFLSIIGHDLKNPFNSVLGLSNLIIDQWKSLDEEERYQITNEINSSSQSIYELLDNLLIWSRTQNNNTQKVPEIFDLNESILQIYEIFRNQATFKNINVRLEISGVKRVFADPNMISTVIRNLLSNSLKFTHDGGQIVLQTEQKADMVEFSISDNGKGILPEDLKRIFEDKGHKTTKGTANETGSGLGLLLAKDFIQQNNGIIWVESKPGKGSLFTFALPAS